MTAGPAASAATLHLLRRGRAKRGERAKQKWETLQTQGKRRAPEKDAGRGKRPGPGLRPVRRWGLAGAPAGFTSRSTGGGFSS
jgi:hypothetical protein